MIPRVGDVVFVMTHGNFISELFSKIMGSKWSHCAICFGELNNETALLETNDYCVNVNFFQRYLDDPKCSVQVLRRPIVISDDEKKTIQKQGTHLIGQLYGYLQLPVGALRRIISMKIPRFIKQGLWCCDVIAYSYVSIDCPMKNKEPETYDTEELYKMLLDSKWEVILDKK